jgi:hypothetical protein
MLGDDWELYDQYEKFMLMDTIKMLQDEISGLQHHHAHQHPHHHGAPQYWQPW